jgi:hypothetical protein
MISILIASGIRRHAAQAAWRGVTVAVAASPPGAILTGWRLSRIQQHLLHYFGSAPDGQPEAASIGIAAPPASPHRSPAWRGSSGDGWESVSARLPASPDPLPPTRAPKRGHRPWRRPAPTCHAQEARSGAQRQAAEPDRSAVEYQMQRSIAVATSLDELEGLLASYGPQLTVLAAANAAASTVRLLKPLQQAQALRLAEAGRGAPAPAGPSANQRYRGKSQRALLLQPALVQRVHGMLAPLPALLQGGMASLRPQAAITAVTALHKLGLPVAHLGPRLLAHCTQRLDQLDGNFLAGLLSGLATLDVPYASLLAQQPQAVAAKLQAPGTTVASLCSVLWCAASAGLGDGPLAREGVRQLLARGFPEGALPSQVPVALWAAAQAASPDAELFRRAAPALLARAGGLQPQQLASSVWALGRAGHADPQLLEALTRRAAVLARRFTDAELTTVVASLLHLGHDAAQMEELWAAVAPVAAARLMQYSPVELAALAFYITKQRLHDDAVVRRMGDYVMERGESLQLATLSNLLWLFSGMQPQREEVLRKLARLAAREVGVNGGRHSVKALVSCAFTAGGRRAARGRCPRMALRRRPPACLPAYFGPALRHHSGMCRRRHPLAPHSGARAARNQVTRRQQACSCPCCRLEPQRCGPDLPRASALCRRRCRRQQLPEPDADGGRGQGADAEAGRGHAAPGAGHAVGARRRCHTRTHAHHCVALALHPRRRRLTACP